MNTEGSGLFPYGLGIVAVTKEDNVDTVMFFPAEKLSLEYGGSWTQCVLFPVVSDDRLARDGHS